MPYFSSRMTNDELAAYFAAYTTQQLEAEANGCTGSGSEDCQRIEDISTVRLGLLRGELQRREWVSKKD